MKIYVIIKTCNELGFYRKYIATFKQEENAKRCLEMMQNKTKIKGDKYEIFTTTTIED